MSKVKVADAMMGGVYTMPRKTQPEELAFMFMRIMDEIGAARSKARKSVKNPGAAAAAKEKENRDHRETIASVGAASQE